MADMNIDLRKFNKVYTLRSVIWLVFKTVLISVVLTSVLWAVVLASMGVSVS